MADRIIPALRRLACFLALASLGFGAAVISTPVRTAGPMNIDLSMPIGVVSLVGGLLLLEAAPANWRRRACLLGAAAVLLLAGRNLYLYPPTDDGAYFMLRYGREAAEDWAPASPFAHALAFAAANWALIRARFSRRSTDFVPKWRRP
jgi:hypothetical protein